MLSKAERVAQAAVDQVTTDPGTAALVMATLDEARRPPRLDVDAHYGEAPRRPGRDLVRLARRYREAENTRHADAATWAMYRHAVLLEIMSDTDPALERLTALARDLPKTLAAEASRIWLHIGILRGRRGEDAAAAKAFAHVAATATSRDDLPAAQAARALLPVARYRAGDMDGALAAAIDELDRIWPLPPACDHRGQRRRELDRAVARDAGFLGVLSNRKSDWPPRRVAADILQRRGWDSLPAHTSEVTRSRLALDMALRALDLGLRGEAEAFFADARLHHEETVAVLERLVAGWTPSEKEQKILSEQHFPRPVGFNGGYHGVFEDQVVDGALAGGANTRRRLDRLARLCLEPAGPALRERTELSISITVERYASSRPARIDLDARGGEVPRGFAACVKEVAPRWLRDEESSLSILIWLARIQQGLPTHPGRDIRLPGAAQGLGEPGFGARGTRPGDGRAAGGLEGFGGGGRGRSAVPRKPPQREAASTPR
ncbi:MAG: hypothetical protein R3B72_49805 [Polyangiaceae bacterium]